MKQLAVVLAAILSFTLVAPALAQPFADVPTDHWAYDAIAELAAKGLIEGYPDGAFRGDRAATRYELAMVVARLLARIEAIKIPPLPADLVRTPQLNTAIAADQAAIRAVDQRLTAKLATIQRLVAEFRAELAALGVRVTAVEEELAALRARLDNTRVTGDMRFRYNVYPSNTPSGSGTLRSPDARLRARITFTGSVSPNVSAVVRLRADNNAGLTGAAADTRFGNGTIWNTVGFDLLYLDIKRTWGADLWRIGRQYYTLGGAYDPLGGALLFDPANTGQLSTGTSMPATIDGLLSKWTLGPLAVEVGLWRDNLFCAVGFPFAGGTCTGLGTQNQGYWDYKTLRVTTGALIPGWTLGGSYYDQGAFEAIPAVFLRTGKGYGVDLNGRLTPWLTLFIDWASWQDAFTNVTGTLITFPSSNAWRVGGNLDLAKCCNITTWSPNVDFAYNNFGPLGAGSLAPFYSYAMTGFTEAFVWNMRGFMVALNLTFSPKASAWIRYEGGTELVGNSNFSEWWLRFSYKLAPNTDTYIQYTKTNCASAVVCPGFGGDILNFYRAELSYRW